MSGFVPISPFFVAGGIKGATTSSVVTATAEGVDHNALDAQLYFTGVAINPASENTLVALSAKLPATIGQLSSSQSISVALASDQHPFANYLASGTLTTTGSVEVSCEGCSNVGVFTTGSWSGSIVFEQTVDDINWSQTILYRGGFKTKATSATENVGGLLIAAGYHKSRVRATSLTSGSIYIAMAASAGTGQTRTAFDQQVVESTKNSTTTNLGAEATFTGESDSTLGVAAIQIFFIADQPCLVKVQQSIDEVNWDISDEFFVEAGQARGRTTQAVGAYFRTIVVNDGTSATTYFRLSTILCPTVEVLPRTLTDEGRLKLTIATTGYEPSCFSFTDRNASPTLKQDAGGALIVRANVTTDEFNFRDDFDGGSIYGSLTGQSHLMDENIVGESSAFRSELFRGRYVKRDTDPDINYVQIKDVYSDTYATLRETYAGTGSLGTTYYCNWKPRADAGSIALASSEVQLLASTGSSEVVQIKKYIDYQPLVLRTRLRLDQRIADQDVVVGFADADVDASPANRAWLLMSGTDNTLVKFQTSFVASNVQSTLVSLPGGATTSVAADWKVEVLEDACLLWYNDTKVAIHKLRIPCLYQPLNAIAAIHNTTTTASPTSLYIDYMSIRNVQRLEIANTFSGEPIPVIQQPSTVATITSVPGAASDTTLLAANTLRVGATIYNDSTAVLYLKLGTGASSSSYTVKILQQGYYELPFNYQGVVNGAWSAAAGNALITEVI